MPYSCYEYSHFYLNCRLVLSACSDYFSAMFTSDVMEAGQQEITLQGIDGAALQSIINYMYSGKWQNLVNILIFQYNKMIVGLSDWVLQSEQSCRRFSSLCSVLWLMPVDPNKSYWRKKTQISFGIICQLTLYTHWQRKKPVAEFVLEEINNKTKFPRAMAVSCCQDCLLCLFPSAYYCCCS